jgi:DNA-binding MurR/RpiR family transcriptional regulator
MHTAECLDIEIFQKCVDVIKGSQTVYVIATGNTTPIAMDMAFRLGRFGIRAVSSIIPEYFLGYIALASENDLVIGITHSGSSKNVIHALELARERGIKTIAITDATRSPVARVSDYILCTSVSNPIFHDFGPTSHVYEMAVIDALLYFIAKKDESQVDKVELILSEYKV